MHVPPKKRPTSNLSGISAAAFTLVELLVVIAILMILAGLLLPMLVQARMRAKRIQCLGNEKQLAITWQLYISDNNDWLVANGMNNPPTTAQKEWVQGAFVSSTAVSNTAFLLDPKYALFANYIKTPQIYLCPSDGNTVNYFGQFYPKVRSYSLNAYLGWNGAWDTRLSSAHRVFTKHGQTATAIPARLFLFQDVHPNSICWPYFGVVMQNDTFFNFPGNSHSRGAVVSFSDGHIEWHRWLDARTIRAYSTDYHKHDDWSPGNQDLAWLRERTTVKK